MKCKERTWFETGRGPGEEQRKTGVRVKGGEVHKEAGLCLISCALYRGLGISLEI